MQDAAFVSSREVKCDPLSLTQPLILVCVVEKVRMFFSEHLHEDEEIRYILEGHGYFDVRNVKDEWIRIRLEKDDLISRYSFAVSLCRCSTFIRLSGYSQAIP